MFRRREDKRFHAEIQAHIQQESERFAEQGLRKKRPKPLRVAHRQRHASRGTLLRIWPLALVGSPRAGPSLGLTNAARNPDHRYGGPYSCAFYRRKRRDFFPW